MALVLNEDEQMLRDTAQSFVADKAPVKSLRALRDTKDETGFDRALWSEMAEMGFAGVLVDEDHGGMGRNLAATPFLSTSVLAATALGKAGSVEQKSEWLTKIATGDAIDQMIVAANTGKGVTLFLVDPKANGLTTERTDMIDSRNAARITLKDVEVTSDAVLGEVDNGAEVLAHVLNAGRAVVGAELVGASSKAFEDTTDYIRERKQFGIEVGRFQALQHRSSHLYSELEIARSAMLAAMSDRVKPLVEKIRDFTRNYVAPLDEEFHSLVGSAKGGRFAYSDRQTEILETMKAEARKRRARCGIIRCG